MKKKVKSLRALLIEHLKQKEEAKRDLNEIKQREFLNTIHLLFCIPPDLDKAQAHGEAQKARYYEDNDNLINRR